LLEEIVENNYPTKAKKGIARLSTKKARPNIPITGFMDVDSNNQKHLLSCACIGLLFG